MISATRDKAGNIVDGSADTVADITDVWTFARDTTSRDRTGSWLAPEARNKGILEELRGGALCRCRRAFFVFARRRGGAASFPQPPPPSSANGRRSVRGLCPTRNCRCRSRFPARGVCPSPGRTWPAGATTTISRPTRRFAPAAARSIAERAQQTPTIEPKALGASLSEPCRIGKSLELNDDDKAQAFFEENFAPLRISRLGEPDSFVTGYYEPVIEGSHTRQTDVYNVPVYRRPFEPVRARLQAGFGQPAQQGPCVSQDRPPQARALLRPRRDRGWRVAGRGLEIAWLKDPTDLLFAQIQGSARIKFDDGSAAPPQLRRL